MKKQRGFTLVELMIAMAIMIILVSVAIVSLRGSQANARDAKRSSDITTIARGLEQRYDNGIAQPTNGTTISIGSEVNVGGTETQLCGGGFSGTSADQNTSYPSTEEINYVTGTTDTSFCPSQVSNFLSEDLPGTSASNFTPPNGGSFVVATSTTVPSAATIGNNYYYLPLTSSGGLCNNVINDICVSYTLYYVSEVSGIVQAVRSRHQ